MATALVVIDVQEAMFLRPSPPDEGAAVVERIKGLIARARAERVPVFFVQHDGGPGDAFEQGSAGWQYHAPLAPKPDDPTVDKRYPSAFHDTDFDQRLKAARIHRLVVCGMQSEFCVDSTVRAAFGLGYEVVLVSDAHTTFDNGVINAAQIRAHHNRTLGGDFAQTLAAAEVRF